MKRKKNWPERSAQQGARPSFTRIGQLRRFNEETLGHFNSVNNNVVQEPSGDEAHKLPNILSVPHQWIHLFFKSL
jgi:hypothetical protein